MSHCNVAVVVPSAWYCWVEYWAEPVCSAHHTPFPSDTVVRSAAGDATVPAPVLIMAVVDVEIRDEKETTAATLLSDIASAAPGGDE